MRRTGVGGREDRLLKEEEQLEKSSDRLSLRRTAAFFYGDSYNL